MENNSLLDGLKLPENNPKANEVTASLLTPLLDTPIVETKNDMEAHDSKAEAAKREEQKRLIEEHNKRIMASPEYKASVVFNNYLATTQYILSGPQKRSLYRKFLREAKRGRYDYLFDEEKIKRREERAKAKFDKLNKPSVQKAEDVPDELKERLVELAGTDEWKHTKPDAAI